jgi:hypothetical protein
MVNNSKVRWAKLAASMRETRKTYKHLIWNFMEEHITNEVL